MIIEQINKYLTEDKNAVSDKVKYEVGKITEWILERQFGESKERESGKLYLSGCGKCARQLAYAYHGYEKSGKEIDSRGKMIFFQGDIIELTLVALAKLAGCNLSWTGFEQKTVELDVDGNKIQGHPDGLMWGDELYLLEIKSMSDFAWQKFQRTGDIDESYIAQVNSYMEALKNYGVNKTIFIGMNKNNGVLHEKIIKKDDKIVKALSENLRIVLNSTKDKLPDPKYFADSKHYYPWQCLYCAYWKHCRPCAEKVLYRNSYKLKDTEVIPESAEEVNPNEE